MFCFTLYFGMRAWVKQLVQNLDSYLQYWHLCSRHSFLCGLWYGERKIIHIWNHLNRCDVVSPLDRAWTSPRRICRFKIVPDEVQPDSRWMRAFSCDSCDSAGTWYCTILLFKTRGFAQIGCVGRCAASHGALQFPYISKVWVLVHQPRGLLQCLDCCSLVAWFFWAPYDLRRCARPAWSASLVVVQR